MVGRERYTDMNFLAMDAIRSAQAVQTMLEKSARGVAG
jgi:hypothetical protein